MSSPCGASLTPDPSLRQTIIATPGVPPQSSLSHANAAATWQRTRDLDPRVRALFAVRDERLAGVARPTHVYDDGNAPGLATAQ